ncbi:MAG: glycosyltransferase [Nanoarchaeota archaeon]|nr:glycosyltransferase [Nanoarchaeota archaeon]
MQLISIIYLGYMFVALYFLSLYIILYFNNKRDLFSYVQTNKKYSISVLVPAFNEEKTIEKTIRAIFKIDYPLKELIVINDGSTDKTGRIVEKLLVVFPKLKIINKENSGKADSLNQGIKITKGELVVVVDADSYPEKDSFGKLVGYFDDEKVGAATCIFIPRNTNKFFERLQDIEYRIIAFTRKLLGYVDAIYVTPGPLAMYRKSALEKIGGFDKKSMTEDIEIAWNLTKHGYERKMCLSTYATTTVPDKLSAWYKQRRRWNIGGLQCIGKYRKYFFKHGMLGFFILPFFTFQLFLGLLGLGVGFYITFRRLLSSFLFTTYSINVGTPLLTNSNLFITPNFLNYLGAILFVVGFIFMVVALGIIKSESLKKRNIIDLIFFSLIYLSVYPFIMIGAIYNFIKKKYEWR